MYTLWSDIDRLFNHSFSDFWDREPERDSMTGLNRMNLIDKGDSFEFVAELPGVEEKDVNLTVHNGTLNLSAKREIPRKKEDGYYMIERGAFDIQRSIGLPSAVNAAETKASFKNGVLRVILPKAPEAQPKQIAINA